MILGGIVSTVDVIALLFLKYQSPRYIFMFINGLAGF